MTKLILVCVLSLFLLGCNDPEGRTTTAQHTDFTMEYFGGLNSWSDGFYIVTLRGMPCVVYSEHAITCDWSRYTR